MELGFGCACRQDELWAEISRLRKQCAEQDEQISKQEHDICALHEAVALQLPGTSGSSQRNEVAHSTDLAALEELSVA
jgi:hypothetical protein